MVKELPRTDHGDVRPWNMILGPSGVTMIDDDDNGLNENWDDALKHCVEGIKQRITDAEWYTGSQG